MPKFKGIYRLFKIFRVNMKIYSIELGRYWGFICFTVTVAMNQDVDYVSLYTRGYQKVRRLSL